MLQGQRWWHLHGVLLHRMSFRDSFLASELIKATLRPYLIEHYTSELRLIEITNLFLFCTQCRISVLDLPFGWFWMDLQIFFAKQVPRYVITLITAQDEPVMDNSPLDAVR